MYALSEWLVLSKPACSSSEETIIPIIFFSIIKIAKDASPDQIATVNFPKSEYSIILKY